MATTLANLKSELLDELKIDPTQRINSTVLLERNINKAYQKIQRDFGYDLPECRTVYTWTPTTQESNLPSDFVRVGEPYGVKIGDQTPVYPADYEALLNNYNLSDAGQPINYWIRYNGTQNVIGFYPNPSTGSYPATLTYLRELPELTSSQSTVLDAEFDELIITYSVYLTMRRIKGYEQKAAEYKAMYESEKKTILANRGIQTTGAIRFGMQRRPRNFFVSPKAVSDYGY